MTTEIKEETQTESKVRTINKVSKPADGALGRVATFDKKGTVSGSEWTDGERTITLPFTEPGGRTPSRGLYTVKAVSPDGVLVQLPLQDQINNNTASPEDYVGLRVYQRKGYQLLFDIDTARGVYCPASDCWAPWLDQFRGACSGVHERELFSNSDNAGNFSQGATTSRTWGR